MKNLIWISSIISAIILLGSISSCGLTDYALDEFNNDISDDDPLNPEDPEGDIPGDDPVISDPTPEPDLWEAIAPTILEVYCQGDTQMNIFWQDNTEGENGFEIERSGRADGPWVLIVAKAADATYHRDSGLSPSTYYYYRVRAYHENDDESVTYTEYSDVMSGRTADPKVPTPTPIPVIDFVYTD